MRFALFVILSTLLTSLTVQASGQFSDMLASVSKLKPLILDSNTESNLVLVGTCSHIADDQALTRSYLYIDQNDPQIIEGGHVVAHSGFYPLSQFKNSQYAIARAFDRVRLGRHYRDVQLIPAQVGIYNKAAEKVTYKINFYRTGKAFGSIYTYTGNEPISIPLRGSEQKVELKQGDNFGTCLYTTSLTENYADLASAVYSDISIPNGDCIQNNLTGNPNPVISQISRNRYQYVYKFSLAMRTDHGGNYPKSYTISEEFEMSAEPDARQKIINKISQVNSFFNTKMCR